MELEFSELGEFRQSDKSLKLAGTVVVSWSLTLETKG